MTRDPHVGAQNQQGYTPPLAVIGMGSSVADGDRVIARALDAIASIAHTTLVSTSALLRTAAFGGQTLNPFWNGACVVETTLAPSALLGALHAIERAHGRVRVTRNAARVLDLDLLVVEHHMDLRARGVGPALPHPGLSTRVSALLPARDAWMRARRGAFPSALRARLLHQGIIGAPRTGVENPNARARGSTT